MSINIWAVVGTVSGFIPVTTLTGNAGEIFAMADGGGVATWKAIKIINSRLLLQAGAVGTPALVQEGSLTSGVYFPAADQLAIAISGTQKLLVEATKMTASFNLVFNQKLLMLDAGADIVAAATTDLANATGNSLAITHAAGNLAITSLGAATIPAGTVISTRFDIAGGNLSLTYSSPGLVLLGGANINLQNGDWIVWRKTNDAAANWEMISFQRGLAGSLITGKGDLITGILSGGNIIPGIKVVGADGSSLVADSSQPDGLIWLPQIPKSLAPNPFFQVNQLQGTGTFADDTYFHDNWYVLSQTNPITPSHLTLVENGQATMARLTQSNAVAQRMGYATILEAADSQPLRGRQFTFRPRVRISNSQAIRIAVLEWTGTADWTSGNYTVGNFFLAANLVVTGVGAKTPSAAALTDMDSLTVTIGNNCNNIILFVWVEQTAAQNVTLDIGKVRFVPGAYAGDIYIPRFEESLRFSERQFWKSFPYATAPAQNAGLTGSLTYTQENASTGNVLRVLSFQNKMRTAGTLTSYNPSVANANVRDTSGGVDRTFNGGGTAEWGFNYGHLAGTNNNSHSVHITVVARL
jgi:hypothetical protein